MGTPEPLTVPIVLIPQEQQHEQPENEYGYAANGIDVVGDVDTAGNYRQLGPEPTGFIEEQHLERSGRSSPRSPAIDCQEASSDRDNNPLYASEIREGTSAENVESRKRKREERRVSAEAGDVKCNAASNAESHSGTLVESQADTQERISLDNSFRDNLHEDGESISDAEDKQTSVDVEQNLTVQSSHHSAAAVEAVSSEQNVGGDVSSVVPKSPPNSSDQLTVSMQTISIDVSTEEEICIHESLVCFELGSPCLRQQMELVNLLTRIPGESRGPFCGFSSQGNSATTNAISAAIPTEQQRQ